jgi:hypothetical protein
MLVLTADGKDCGATIEYSSDSKKVIRAKAQLSSIEHVDSLELIQNGELVKRIDLTEYRHGPMFRVTLSAELRPKRSGWIAARAIFKSPDGRLRQAHTSPIYITVDGKDTASKKDAEYMMAWIDRLLEITNRPGRYESDKQRNEVQAIFREARKVYEEIAAKGG